MLNASKVGSHAQKSIALPNLSVILLLGSMEGDRTEFPECKGSRYPLTTPHTQLSRARHGFPFGHEYGSFLECFL